MLATFCSASSDYTVGCIPEVSMISQDPYPAMAKDYVDVVFQVNNVDGNDCDEGIWFEIVPEYPFSLDGDDAIQYLGDNTYNSEYTSSWIVGYTLRVDEDALDGTYDIEVRYGLNSKNKESYLFDNFTIAVEDATTSFDAVIQDINEDEVSLAIANTGENTANAVIIRVPEQEDFEVTSTDGQMLGNLDAGDYTIVSFNLVETRDAGEDSVFQYDIYYTDDRGERRVVNMETSLDLGGGFDFTEAFDGEGFPGMPGERTSSSWLKYVVIVGAIGLIVGIYFVVKKIRKGPKGKTKSKNKPNWMKKE